MNAAYITLSHSNLKVMRRSLDRLKETQTLDIPHYMLNAHYPLTDPVDLRELCQEYGIILIEHPEQKNVGLHKGFNYVMDQIPHIKYGFGYDPDAMPIVKGWDEKMLKAHEYPGVVISNMFNWASKKEVYERGYWEIEHNGIKMLKPKEACIMGICCCNLDFFRSLGGLQEPNEYYGGLESWLWSKFDSNKFPVYIEGIDEDNTADNLHDQEYTDWKWAHAHQGYTGNFDQYLREKGVIA